VGVFANTLTAICRDEETSGNWSRQGALQWLFERLRARSRMQPKLAVLGRVNLAPRQFLTLVESEGQRLLVASSADGAPAFYPLNSPRRQARTRTRKTPLKGAQ
jgi:flagellar biogenesis protein FliO